MRRIIQFIGVVGFAAILGAQSIEQTAEGTRPSPVIAARFDGLGVGFEGPQGTATTRNPSDNSPAVGPNHIVQTVNSRMAIVTKPLREAVLVEGEAAQASTVRWQDSTPTAVDPSDECTIWYVGDYLKKDATGCSTRIGACQLPGCPPALASRAPARPRPAEAGTP
jgi:hypothetical protein